MGKAILATTIVGIALVGAVFLMQQNAVSAPASDAAQTSGANNIASSQPFVEKTSTNQLAALTAPGANLTQMFGDTLVQDISKGNPGGPTSLNGQNSVGVPDPDTFAQNLVDTSVQKFDPSKLTPVINDSDLHITQDNSTAAVQAYLRQFQTIVTDEANAIPDSVLTTNPPSFDELPTLIGIYKDTIAKFYALSVPAVAVPIQKKEIQLLTEKTYIFSTLSNYQQDPVTAILVANELTNVDQAFSDFSAQLTAFTQKYSA